MGWPLFLGAYYSLTFVGVCIGFLSPIYVAFFSQAAEQGNIPNEAKSFPFLIFASLKSSILFGFYMFWLLTGFGFLCGIGFTIWAIFNEIHI